MAAPFAAVPRNSAADEADDGELRPLAAPASSSAAAAEDDDEDLPYSELFARCWRLMAASALLHMHGDIDQRILTPYFYTRIHCCEPGIEPLPNVMEFGGRDLNLTITAASCRCDVALEYGASAADLPGGAMSACAVPMISRDSPLWSHSAHCSNWPYVREQTQVLITVWGSVAALVSVAILPASGNLADLYGRLNIFVLSSAIVGVGFAVFTLDAAYHLPDSVVILTGVIFGCSRAHGPAAWAMLMDLIPPGSRVKWFPVMSAIAVGAPLLGEAISYPFIAMHLVDYTALWASLCVFGVAVMLFIIFVLEETLPALQQKQWAGWAELLKDASPLGGGSRDALKLWCCQQDPEPIARSEESSDDDDGGSTPAGGGAALEQVKLRRARVLRVILATSLLGAFGTGVFSLANNVLLGALHYKQEELVFLGVFSKAVSIPAALLAALVLPKLGCYYAWLGGSMGTVLGFLCFTTLGYWGPFVTMFIWTVAFAFIKPAVMVYLSVGLRKEDQAKGVAVLGVLDILPAVFGGPFFTAVFFDPNSKQTQAFCFAGLIFVAVSLIIGCGLPKDAEELAIIGAAAPEPAPAPRLVKGERRGVGMLVTRAPGHDVGHL